MSMIEHGDTLTLLRQKADWQPGRAGLFDRGTRRYKCYAADANRWIATTLALGRPDPVERNMFVDARSLEREVGSTAIIRVDLVGVIGGTAAKKEGLIIETGTEEESVVPQVAGVTFAGRLQAMRAVPTVIHRWVTRRRPKIASVGVQVVTPPGISRAETREIASYFDTLSLAGYLVFEGWVRQTRKITTPGDLAVAPIYQVEDAYEYLVKRVQQA